MSICLRVVCAVVVCGCLAIRDAVAATTIVNSGGFEGYSLTDLAGQSSNAGPWLQAHTLSEGDLSTAVVQDSVFHPFPDGGSKAVRVDRKAQDDAYWAVLNESDPLTDGDLIIIEWDMKVEPSGVIDAFGPFFGVQAIDASPSPLLLGSVGVDSATGEILYQEADTGILTPIDSALGISVNNQWRQFRMAIDYTNRAYQVVYNGRLILTEPIVDEGALGFTDADITAIAAGGDSVSQNAEGTAYFDNFVVVNLARVPGDYDIDGDVDANDYAVWLDEFGKSTISGTGADGNGDGVVDAADYTVWRDNYLPAPSAGPSAAPEPTALALLGIGVAYACRRRFR
ncbi:hypothetical protein KOR34_20260 [Posidoniimonas corsicana]|uniref:Uncharacterized protein n=1 Tax=Posidoniimonas corsicana TaxID=1938618 RepID=A0A5C5VGQ4_9BACT|nr:PEP-CTERM sorting domain-containing protein [Posidoniimonas corsicana]TWT37079.1 hypothetical protein KOR34_20260 [Posidoniimonas corsicana]